MAAAHTGQKINEAITGIDTTHRRRDLADVVKRHATDRVMGEDRVYTALAERCTDCARKLPIYQVDSRRVQGLDEAYWMRRRDKRCQAGCPGKRPIIYAPRDLRLVLPRRIYGLDVTLFVGERHLLDGISLSQISRDLKQRGAPIDQRHTCRVFRDFVALTQLVRGDDAAVQARLRAQGGIVLMCDGVQFEERSPVLYLVWDAISAEPLFGERKPYRGEEDLIPLLERVRAMNVPVIGIVTDKETGLVPAVESVFPQAPYQYCQTHFLKNCAKPLANDLTALQASVRRRADAVREIGKLIAHSEPSPANAATVPESTTSKRQSPAAPEEASPVAEMSAQIKTSETISSGPQTDPDLVREVDLAREICELVRVNSRVGGKAPLDPPELKRHDRLENLRHLVNDARQKKPRSRRRKRVAVA